jgi:hypothetical protein
MARKQDTRAIGGHTFQVTQLGYEPGREMLFKLVQTLGEGISGLAASSQEGVLNEDAAKAIGGLVRGLDYGLLKHMSDRFAENTLVGFEGSDKMVPLKGGMEENVFAGAYDVWILWLAFCLEHNFAESIKKVVAEVQARSPAKAA